MGIYVVKIDLGDAEYQETFKKDVITIDFLLRLPSRIDTSDLLSRLAALEGILEVGWDGGEMLGSMARGGNFPRG